MTRTLGRLRRDTRGVAAVEAAAMISFVLLPLTAGVIGSGMAMLEQARLDRGLHAGLMAAWGTTQTNWGSTSTATTALTAVQNAATAGYGPYSPAMTANATVAYYCISPTGTRSGVAAASGPTATCTSGQVLGTWVTVTTSVSFTPIFTSTWGSTPWTLSAVGTARVE